MDEKFRRRVEMEPAMSAFPTIRPRVVGDDLVQTVNARDLHACLEIGRDFSSWIKGRLAKFGFALGADYATEQVFPRSGENPGGRPATDFHLTLDTAKELAMVENNDRGRAVRRYFIACERRLRDGRRPGSHRLADESLAARLRAVEACRWAFGIGAAREMWIVLGLPVVPAMRAPAAQVEMPFDLSASVVGGHG